MLVRLANRREAHTENNFGVSFQRAHIETTVAITLSKSGPASFRPSELYAQLVCIIPILFGTYLLKRRVQALLRRQINKWLTKRLVSVFVVVEQFGVDCRGWFFNGSIKVCSFSLKTSLVFMQIDVKCMKKKCFIKGFSKGLSIFF